MSWSPGSCALSLSLQQLCGTPSIAAPECSSTDPLDSVSSRDRELSPEMTGQRLSAATGRDREYSPEVAGQHRSAAAGRDGIFT